jgi:hypothetical protein
LLRPATFLIETPQQQRNVTAGNTVKAYTSAFPGDPIVAALRAVIADPTYLELKEIRNVLSHRSAPGRTIHAAIGDEPAPD